MDDAPGYVASRTCTVVDEREPPRDGGRQAPLTDYADITRKADPVDCPLSIY